MAEHDGNESFEDAFTRLEQTVQALERGGLTLEATLALYEEGMRLAHRCTELLDAAEVKISRLPLLAENGGPDQ
ncbi:MAG: exodeoxyribonuclease VII small subunit [Chloroflexi bacterium]|nr:exodeoxyribonuclease VII small subunit [Chloroflexota bacterium]